MRPARRLRELVLVGGGHAHVQVLRRLVMAPRPDVRVTVVLDRPVAMYSGMVPGVVAGQYRAHEAEIDVWALARRAGARIVDAPAVGLDRAAARVLVEGRPPVAYEAVSFDVGSTVRGLDTPGVRAHAVPTRPIGRFVDRVQAALADRAAPGPRVLVVGAGAGGVELAFCLEHRTKGAITLLDAAPTLLPGFAAGLAARVRAAAAARGITLRAGRVTAVQPGLAHLAEGDPLPFDVLVWVTGAAPHPWMAALDLPRDEHGFLRVTDALHSPADPAVFGAGDCVAVGDHRLPKAGVYAVREGPVLGDNLLARLDGREPRAYAPQRGFLTLLNLGDGTALGAKGPLAFGGGWALRWKDRIDRRFMAMFQSIGPDDTPTFTPMADADMTCGGCAAKVGPGELARALGRLGAPVDASVELGLDRPDDAAVVRTPGGERLGLTVDAFTAFCDDPWLVGRVAAVNALNDLYVKRIRPAWALALVGIPDDGATEETLFQVMHGARTTLDAHGVTLVGGHTLRTDALQVGFAVTGLADGPVPALGGLRPGQSLVLTRPLGTGVLLHAHASGRARGPWVQAAVGRLIRSHRDAAKIAQRFGATAATDVTGFGLAGHLVEMLRASRCAAALDLAALPVLDGAESLLRQGVRSTFHAQNTHAMRWVAGARDDDPRVALLFDPQTAGPLLFGVPGDGAEVLAALHAAGETDARIVGRTLPGEAMIHL